jgi:hypothetical protein
MTDLVAKMRARTKVVGLVTLFGCAFAASMAIRMGNRDAGIFGVAWCLGTAIVGDGFFKFLLEDLKRSREVERDDG